MKRGRKITRLFCLIFAVCLILTVTSVPVFADESTEENINCPSGVTIKPDGYNHTYHTNVKITANVTC